MGLLTACDPIDRRLVIDNQTNEEVIYKIKRTKDFQDTVLFEKWNLNYNPPDTTYQVDFGSLGAKSKMNISSIFGTGFNTWEEGIKEKCEDGMLTVFIFNKSTLNEKSFTNILTDKDYKTFRLSTTDLEKTKWTIEVK
jgi:hypothetical protein